MMPHHQGGIIDWFARNSVAANLLMWIIIIGGLVSYSSINKKMFPEFSPNMITVSVPYPGAAPEEVEKSVVLKVEEALEDVEGIKRITAVANEGVARVNLEILLDYDLGEKLDEVKMQIDSITTFPEQIEKPIVRKVEFQADVMWVSVYGIEDRRTRQELAKKIRDEIMQLSDVNLAEVVGNRPYEISIEVSEFQLKKFGLTFDDVARAVRRSSVDVPGGTIKTDGGDILLRSKGQAYTGVEYEQIVLRTNPDGTHLVLRDVANVIDGFVEADGYSRFNRLPATNIRVKSTGDQNDLKISKAVNDYLQKKRKSLPEEAKIDVWGDGTYYLNARLDMMLNNMLMGALLVFLILATFLRIKIAFWVMLGIPICFFGAFLLMPSLGDWSVTINMLSLFAFIMVLGIVVDDAIVIGESVYSEIREKGHSVDNVIAGTHRVAVPATFGVLTTIAAFAPLLMIESMFSPFFRTISIVVSACLIFSLIESKWILPAHLAHMKYQPIDEKNANFIERYQAWFRKKLEHFIETIYQPWLTKALHYRYHTVSFFVALMILSIGLIAGGIVKQEMIPSVPSDFIQGRINMIEGSPQEARDLALERIENAIFEIDEAYQKETGEKSFLKHSLLFTSGETSGFFLAELTKPEERNVDAFDIEKMWRDKVGKILGSKDLRFFSAAAAGGGAGLEFQLVGSDEEQLNAATEMFQQKLAEYDGVYDIRNTLSGGNQEIQLKIKPQAEVLGLTLSDLGRQVRQAFYGEEAQRIQRGRDELKVMVRYPMEDRRSVADLESMWIRTPSGQEVPFSQVAEVTFGKGFSSITRVNQRRSVTISADIDYSKVESSKIYQDAILKIIPEILAKYPDVKSGAEGSAKENRDLLMQFVFAIIAALCIIYTLIAIPTRSYGQPIIIMSVIPFGVIGAIVGHWLVGRSLGMMSWFGVVALVGVVVNDSLVMVDFVNKAREKGVAIIDAVVESGSRRFRPILLTSLTTFFGVVPIFFETSLQAQFIIPMAVSIGFGILFATVITLFLIPCLYLLLEDFKGLFGSKKRLEQVSKEDAIQFSD
ncbi:MAG: efflux RND transporter permease subunit [Gammaproteobacteria bacterium]|nr:efflux RND transporter permease subunit [Gammaproteobacteria bacterium]